MSNGNYEFIRVAEREVPEIYKKVSSLMNELASGSVKECWDKFINACAEGEPGKQELSESFDYEKALEFLSELKGETRLISESNMSDTVKPDSYAPKVNNFVTIGNIHNFLSHIIEMNWERDFINQIRKEKLSASKVADS